MREKKTGKIAAVIGAGPAGLTAALELLERTDIHPVVFEVDDMVGGLSRTVVYKGNRIDIGGHRFFSKSDRVMNWWRAMMPIAAAADAPLTLAYRRRMATIEGGDRADPQRDDNVMLVRRRLSRIFYRGRFFDYPLSLTPKTIRDLGLASLCRIAFGYARAVLFPIRPERSLEDFLINRFGRELYATFFEDYTEKVWGRPCREIGAEWGAQRIKGLSIAAALRHAAMRAVTFGRKDVAQKKTETSLIERFLYPKFGPGQMWELTAARIVEKGGELRKRRRVVGVCCENGRVVAVACRDGEGREETHRADYVFSTMPIVDLIPALRGVAVPEAAREAAAALVYRDFMTVGLLFRKLHLRRRGRAGAETTIDDNWIYIQEKTVRVGRLQIFNNWSPWMVADPDTIWLGMEYFCRQGDDLWSMPDADLIAFAVAELERIGFVRAEDCLDGVVLRAPKTYPAYFGGYERFGEIRRFLDGIDGLFPVGRNGMHKYNNADHSMLAAMTAVDLIVAGRRDRDVLWNVNAESDYHEEI